MDAPGEPLAGEPIAERAVLHARRADAHAEAQGARAYFGEVFQRSGRALRSNHMQIRLVIIKVDDQERLFPSTRPSCTSPSSRTQSRMGIAAQDRVAPDRRANRKAAVARHPNAERTAWRRFHFIIRARLRGPASSPFIAISTRLTGMTPRKVHGQLASINTPPTM